MKFVFEFPNRSRKVLCGGVRRTRGGTFTLVPRSHGHCNGTHVKVWVYVFVFGCVYVYVVMKITLLYRVVCVCLYGVWHVDI